MYEMTEELEFILKLLTLDNATSAFMRETVEKIASEQGADFEAFKLRLVQGDIYKSTEIKNSYDFIIRHDGQPENPIWTQVPSQLSAHRDRIIRLRIEVEKILRVMLQKR